jgi:hypothetical protein
MRYLMISATARSLAFDRRPGRSSMAVSRPSNRARSGVLVALVVLGLVLSIFQSEVGGGSTSSLTEERPAPAPAPVFVVGNSGLAHGPGTH